MTDSESIPECVGIILDGNRRWAKEHDLPTFEGHRRGFDRLIDCVRWVRGRGIPHLVVYAFSTENWSRMEKEVSYLMDLFRESVEKTLTEMAKDNVRIRFIGKLAMLPNDLQEAITRLEESSANNTAITLWICMSYGSRAEIVSAAASLTKSGDEATEENFAQHLWSAGMPDPDIIIRPGGEKRLSNFLLWQAAYSELFFIDALWPDFSEKILDDVLKEYAERERRHGR
jgi:undecaprenyl diphosphate synthase